MKKTNNKKILKGIWFYARVILVVLVLLFPFIIMLSISLKETAETIGYPPTIIPRNWEIQHFFDIFNANIFPFNKYMRNSLYIALATSVIAVLLGILGGYGRSRKSGRLEQNGNHFPDCSSPLHVRNYIRVCICVYDRME